MIPSVILNLLVLFFAISPTQISSKSIVIEINGDCKTVGETIAQEHGYRFVRQVCFYCLMIEC